MQQGTKTAHFLNSQGYNLSASSKHSEIHQPLTCYRDKKQVASVVWHIAKHASHSLSEEPRIGVINRLELYQGMLATHYLKSQEQVLLAEWKHSKECQPLTPWKVKYSCDQQTWEIAKHASHSQTENPRTDIVSRLQAQQSIAVTHQLMSQKQTLSAGLK